MLEILICKICKEPINNFVSIDSLSKDIKGWLPGSLSASFNRFNSELLDIFHYNYADENHHIISSSNGSGSICLYCYVNEVFQWMKGQNKHVAKRFKRIFSFGMKSSGFREIINAHAEPISEVENMKEEFGVCDECGEYAESLKLVNGRWICIECKGE